MPILNISKVTYDEVIEEEKKLRQRFALAILKDRQEGLALRTIAKKRKISHETARRIIQDAEKVER